MKRLIIFLGCCLLLGHLSFAQGVSNEQKIAQVYGSYVNAMPIETKNFLNNCITRCSISSNVLPIGDSVKSISVLAIQNKYIPNLSDTNIPFNEANFNPLIYVIDFFSNKNQYFIIDANHLLKVAKKEQ